MWMALGSPGCTQSHCGEVGEGVRLGSQAEWSIPEGRGGRKPEALLWIYHAASLNHSTFQGLHFPFSGLLFNSFVEAQSS